LSKLVEHCPSWHSHIGKDKSGIIDAIETNLVAHILDVDSRAWLHVFHASNLLHAAFANLDDEGVDTLVLTIDNCLSEHDSMIGVTSSIGNPVLLRHGRRAVNNKLLSLGIVGSSGLHLGGVVAITKLCEAEAAHNVK